MKKCLIIVMDLTNSAAGIVYKRLIQSMQIYHRYDIFCPCADEYAIQNFNILPCGKYRRLHHRLSMLLYHGLGYILTDKLWAYLNKKNILNIIARNNYDSIISFVYGGNTAPIVLGKILKNKINLPWIVYSVDALPTPISWTNNSKQFKVLFEHIKKHILAADALYWSNPIMKEYQERLFNKYKGKYGVVLTPGGGEFSNNDNLRKSISTIFLYAGQIYGPRKIDALLSGFEKYLRVDPNAKLIFVGHCGKNNFANFSRLVLDGNIEIYPFANDIDSYFEKADILVDINANVENDVFLSSKVCHYISYNKPILAISHDGSPVRFIMKGYNSIVHCHHNDDEILKAMQQAVHYLHHYQDDRETLRQQFLASTIAREFCNDINELIENYTVGIK